MKAIVVEKSGGVDGLTLAEVAKPEVRAPNDVLVKVFAASVNPIDTKLRAQGLYVPESYPAILGCDGAGVVEAVGDAVEQFQVGDPVYYCYGGLGQRQGEVSLGNHAEYIVVPEHVLAVKPDSLGYLQAAAAPLVLITAWEALFDRVGLRSGQKVFVQGGAGGVGHVAIQLAKIAGCTVATSVSTDEKASFVETMGADLVIRYQDEDVAESLLAWTDGLGVDVCFATADINAMSAWIPAMAHYGQMVSVLQLPQDLDFKALRLKNISLSQELMLTPMLFDLHDAAVHQAAILEECGQLIDQGQLTVYVAQVLPMEDVAQAHTQLEAGHTQGKIVLAIAGEEEAL